jgi:outer membrane protein assembly factor BamB
VAKKKMKYVKSLTPWQSISRGKWLATPQMLPLAILTAWAALTTLPAWGELVTQPQATRMGLERAWFAQVDLDPARHRITNWLLHDNLLFAVTSAGTIHALDATTGRTAWAVQVGQPKYPTLGPAANHNAVAVINGSKLILLDRTNGHLLWTRETGNAPSSGPALSATRVFVALINGRVEAYPLKDTKQTPWFYQSAGRVYHQPTATKKSICWATDLGTMYVGRLKPLSLLFRLELEGEIVASPTSMAPYLLVGSTHGNLTCIHEESGVGHWRYITGYPISYSPAVVGDQVFVTSQEPMLHTLDASTGQRQWTLAGVTQFVALGKQHVYGMDRYGSLLAIDAKTGGIVGRLPRNHQQSWSEQSPWNEQKPALINDQNDRIYLVQGTGLVQCLHEIGVSDPIPYRQPASDSEKKLDSTATKTGDTPEGSLEQDAFPSTESDQARDNTAVIKTPDAEAATQDSTDNDDPFGEPSNPFGE